MKRLLLALSSIATALCLPGCLQSETTIHLNKDGSGTIVEQATLGAQMIGMMEQIAAIGGEGAKDPLGEMFSEKKAKAKASTYGEGVTFEKTEPITAGASKGAKSTYKFADINKLKISPGESMSDMAPEGQAAPATKQKPVTFTYAGGKLTVNMPEDEKPAGDAAGKPATPNMADNPQAEMMMKQMMGDLKMSFKLVAESGIASTDATHHEGNAITLMEVDMAKVLKTPDGFKKLTSADEGDTAAAMAALKGVDGVKVEAKKVVTVTLE